MTRERDVKKQTIIMHCQAYLTLLIAITGLGISIWSLQISRDVNSRTKENISISLSPHWEYSTKLLDCEKSNAKPCARLLAVFVLDLVNLSDRTNSIRFAEGRVIMPSGVRHVGGIYRAQYLTKDLKPHEFPVTLATGTTHRLLVSIPLPVNEDVVDIVRNYFTECDSHTIRAADLFTIRATGRDIFGNKLLEPTYTGIPEQDLCFEKRSYLITRASFDSPGLELEMITGNQTTVYARKSFLP